MTAGPIVTFGFLVVPPLTARLVTRRMLDVLARLGGASVASTAFAGFYCAYRFDLPLGPAEVAVASVAFGVWPAPRTGCSSREAASLALLRALRRRGARRSSFCGCARRRSSLVRRRRRPPPSWRATSPGLGLGAALRAARHAARPVRRYGPSSSPRRAWRWCRTASLRRRLPSRRSVSSRQGDGSLALVVVSLAVLAGDGRARRDVADPRPGAGDSRHRRLAGGLLYALNTLGGVGGIAAMGFGLPAAIGVRASYVADGRDERRRRSSRPVGRRRRVAASRGRDAAAVPRVRLRAAAFGDGVPRDRSRGPVDQALRAGPAQLRLLVRGGEHRRPARDRARRRDRRRAPAPRSRRRESPPVRSCRPGSPRSAVSGSSSTGRTASRYFGMRTGLAEYVCGSSCSRR